MSKNKPLARHLHTFIEPDAIAVTAISEAMNELARRVPVTTATKCQEAIKAFAIEVAFDIFSPLLASPHMNVRSVGERQLGLAAAWTGSLFSNLSLAKHAYTNTLPSNVKPFVRKMLVADHILTREEFGGDTSPYDNLPPEVKAQSHLARFFGLCREQVVACQRSALINDTPPHENHPVPKELYSAALAAALKNGSASFDLLTHPKLIGIAMVFTELEVAIGRQMVKLNGDKTPQETDQIIQNMRASVIASFDKPRTPDDHRKYRLAQRAFADLRPGGAAH